jgi:hypothetical protein
MSRKQKKIEQSFSSHNLKVLNHLKEPSDKDLCNQYLYTNQQMSNQQQLFDFISDKGKICFKSYFDQKGSIEFLNEMSEAMKKIELNEFIIEDNNEKEKEVKNEKHMEKYDEKNNFEEIKNKISNDPLNNKNIKNIRTQKDNIKKLLKAKKSIKTKSENEEERKTNNIIDSRNNINNNYQVNSKKKNNKANIFDNNDKSIDSQITVNSKLFNNYKDYQKSKKLLSREDLPLIEELLSLLQSKKI